MLGELDMDLAAACQQIFDLDQRLRYGEDYSIDLQVVFVVFVPQFSAVRAGTLAIRSRSETKLATLRA